MSPDAYARAIAELISALILVLLRVFGLVPGPKMSPAQWDGILRLAYPHVEQARSEAARLARAMYDDQRSFHHPNLPRNDQPLEGSTFEDFARALEPARRRISQVDSVDKAIGILSQEMAKQVENAGRRQIIHAVQSDPGPQVIRKWARVATGRETCAWCLMLISRGAVYFDAESAGEMDQWHAGCDCKVVPVFQNQFWPGQAAADRALEQWKSASAEAARLIAAGKARTSDHNKEAINELRRRIYRGEINPQDYAGLAA